MDWCCCCSVFSTIGGFSDCKFTRSDPLTYESFANGVIWNNFSLSFPFVITLIGGYLINREYTDQTLKTS